MNISKHFKSGSFIATHFLSILLVVFYISEGYNKYLMFEVGNNSNIPKMIKSFVFIIVLYNLFDKKIIKQLILITTCFILGQLFITPNFDFVVLGVFLKYLFPLLLFAYFNKFKLSDKALKYLQIVFEGLIFFNSLLIFVGFVFKTHVLTTYGGGRFGFNGILITSVTSTYVYLAALLYFLLKYKDRFIYKAKVLIVILASLIVGTKSLYLSIGFILIFYFFLFTTNRKKIIGILLIFVILCLGVYFTLFKWETFNNIVENDGMLTAILSYRDKLLIEEMIPFINNSWSLVNYLFGGVNDISTRSQMGFIDVFYFFGILGGALYLWSFAKSYIKFKLNVASSLFLFLICTVIFIAGNFFLNASVAVYMIVIREEMLKYGNIINKKLK